MKFVHLGRERAHQRDMSDISSRAILEPCTGRSAHDQIHTDTELQQQIHNDLRLQHPEWVQPNGESPICDSYEARLIELLGTLTRRAAISLISDPARRGRGGI
jgi:hypothetical protein